MNRLNLQQQYYIWYADISPQGPNFYVVGIVSQRRALKGQVARGACTDGDLVIRVGHVNLPE